MLSVMTPTPECSVIQNVAATNVWFPWRCLSSAPKHKAKAERMKQRWLHRKQAASS